MMRGLALLVAIAIAGALAACGQSSNTSKSTSGAASGSTSTSATAKPGCPYLPEFQHLQTELLKLGPAETADRLNRYAAAYSNPEGCEATEIERLLNRAETQLFHLTYGDTRHAAQLTLRCDDWDIHTARCRGSVEDGTAHPSSQGLAALTAPTTPLRLDTELTKAKLIGVYFVSLAAALEGKPAQRISSQATFSLPAGVQHAAVIAIYETEGVWRFRKAVWYF